MIDKPTRDKHGPNHTNVQPIIHATQDEVIEIFTLASKTKFEFQFWYMHI